MSHQGGFQLRTYQREAIKHVVDARRSGVRRMVVALPTGAGKTVIFSSLVKMAQKPALVLAHRHELLEQAREKLTRTLGDSALVSLEQGNARAEAGARVVVASIRSLSEERIQRLRENWSFGLVIYDECHHAPAEDNMRVLTSLGAFEDDWPGTLVGFTATTVRGDGVALKKVFQKIVFHQRLSSLVDQGYLVPLRGYRIVTSADLSSVSVRAGDFSTGELAEAVDISERNALVARSIQELARDRRTLVFCVNVNHARSLAHALNAIEIPTGIVHGAMKREARAEALRAFRRGQLRALTNVGVLTEGFDDPEVSCVAMARPTRSSGLYAQCVGRGTRLFKGKSDCLVLDFVDLADLSLVTLPTLAGLPPRMDLEGEALHEAERALSQIWDISPGFEVPPEAITLDEIKDRAAHFDPLSLDVDAEVQAVSENAWESLGSRGLSLHLHWKRGKISHFLVLEDTKKRGRGRRWVVRLDDHERARFSRLEEAVEAVDYEVEVRSKACAESAKTHARWRVEETPTSVADALLEETGLEELRHGDARRRLAYARFGPKRGRAR